MLISGEGLTADLKEGNTVLGIFEVGKIYRMYIRAYDRLGARATAISTDLLLFSG